MQKAFVKVASLWCAAALLACSGAAGAADDDATTGMPRTELGQFLPPDPLAPTEAEKQEAAAHPPRTELRQFLPPDLLAADEPAPASEDPIRPIAVGMKAVVGDLSALKTDAPVQSKEKEVASALDAVIKQLEQQCKGSGSGSNPNPTKPMNQSILAKGPGGSGPLHDPQAGTRVWGQLPPKEREKILQSQTEGFPAGYESVLANYYSRLAQEQVAAEAKGAGPAEPTTRPLAP